MTLPATPSLDAARQELATRIEAAKAAWTDYELIVEPENRHIVDLGSSEAQRAFLAWDIVWRRGRQASMGHNPLAVQYGQLVVAAKIKDGCGSASCYLLLDHVIPYLEAKDGTLVRTQVAEVSEGRSVNGWYGVPVIINFWIHRIVPTA